MNNKTPKILTTLVLTFFALTLFSCKKKQDDYQPRTNATLSLVNALAGSDNLDFYLNGVKKSAQGVPFATKSAYAIFE